MIVRVKKERKSKKIHWLLTLVIAIINNLLVYPQNRIVHNDQEIFLSGMNLAWVSFAKDLTDFNESEFTRALNEISSSGGNSMRWWLHVNGKYSPQFTNDSVSGITQTEINSIKKGLDLAYDRNMGLILCLWSFDMLRSSIGSTYTDRNKLLLNDPAYTDAYIENALKPILQQIGDHPAIICWEIFNEPEGMSNEFGWSFTEHVPMASIQRFINKLSGAIHREVPTAKVSNGSWSFKASTNISGNYNYYTDDRLINAGGDTLGTLDFYMVHYYDWAGTALSPFHHPVGYWALDKPLVVAEFSAKGPYSGITPTKAYDTLYKNDYAGSLSWTWSGHDGHGDITDVGPAMELLFSNYSEDIFIDYKGTGINYPPKVVKEISDTAVSKGIGSYEGFQNLNNYFHDNEDTTVLDYKVTEVSNNSLVSAEITQDSILNFSILNESTGISIIKIEASDSKGRKASSDFVIYVYDPDTENRALFRKAFASSEEDDEKQTYMAVDGKAHTRWSSVYSDDQWIIVELANKDTIRRVELDWEVAYGKEYEVQSSDDQKSWTTLYSEKNSDGGKDVVQFDPVYTRYIKIKCNKRATEWGFSLWELSLFKDMITDYQMINTPLVKGMEVFPVPTYDYVSVKIEGYSAIKKIEIFNSQAQCVKTIYPQENLDIYKVELTELPTGLYYLVAVTDGIHIAKVSKL